MATQVEVRIVEVQGKIDANFVKQLDQINKHLGTLQQRVKSIQGLGSNVLQGVIGVGFIVQLQKMVDLQTELGRTLKAGIPPYQSLAQTQEDLLQISIDTQNTFEDTVRLYNRLTIAGRDLGIENKAIQETVTAFNLSLVAAGTGLREAAAASQQLGQALASGRVQGDEFKSIMENVPLLARVLAKNFENASGSLGVTVGELRDLSAAGELTTEKVIEAFQRGLPELEKLAEGLPRTIGSAIAGLNDAVGQVIGRADELSGASGKISNAIQSTSDTLVKFQDTLALIAGPLGIGAVVAAFGALAVAAGKFVIVPALAFLFLTLPGQIVLAVAALPSFGVALVELAARFDLFRDREIELSDLVNLKDLDTVATAIGDTQKRLDEVNKQREQTAAALANTSQGAGALGSQNTERIADLTATFEAQSKEAKELTAVVESLRAKYALLAKDAEAARDAQTRGEDPAEKFQEVTAAIQASIVSLDDQIAAVEKNDGSFEKLTKTVAANEAGLKALDDAIKANLPSGRDYEAMVRQLGITEAEQTDILKDLIAAQKELNEFREEGAQLDLDISNPEALLTVTKQNTAEAEALARQHEIGAEIEKRLGELREAGVDISGAEAVAFAEKIKKLSDLKVQTEQAAVATEALYAVDQKIANDNKTVEALRQKVAATQQGSEAVKKLADEEERQQFVNERLNELIEKGVAIRYEQLQQIVDLANATVNLNNAEELLAERSKGREAFQTNLAAKQQELANAQKIAEAARTGGAAAADKERDRIEAATKAQELLNNLSAKDTAERDRQEDLVNNIAQQTVAAGNAEEQALEAERKRNQAAEQSARERLAIAEKQKKFPEGPQRELEQDTAAAKAQLQSFREVGEEGRRLAEARAEDEDKLKDIAEQARRAMIQVDEEFVQKQKNLIAEQRTAILELEKLKFEKGPQAKLVQDTGNVEAELEALREGGEEGRKIILARIEDEQKLKAMTEQARAAMITIDKVFAEEQMALIERQRAAIRELQIEQEDIALRAPTIAKGDPGIAIGKEIQAIQSGLAQGSFVNEDQIDAANQRLFELQQQLTGVQQAATSLAEMDNPFAGLVQSASDVSAVFSESFKNLDPSQQIAAGGEAALGVLQQVSATMQALNIESFEVQKGIAVATATINAALAVTKVLAEVPPPASYVLAGVIAALAGAQIAIIASQQPPKRALGGPVLPGSLYRVGEMGPEMFQSSSGKNYMIPGEGGNVVRASQTGGGNVIINNLGPPITATTTQDQAGNQAVTIDAAVKATEKRFEQSMAQGYGGFHRGVRKNTNAGRRIA